MRKGLLLLALSLLPWAVQGQELTVSDPQNSGYVTETRSDEMYCDGMMWVFRGSYNVVSCKLEGSKVVNGKTYGLLHVHSDLYGARGTEASVSNPYNSTIGIRYEDGCLYVNMEDYLELFTPGYIWRTIGDDSNLPYETTEDGELVLYDFSKNVGDTYCQLADGTTLTVNKTGVMKTEDGVTRRLLTLSNGLELIEGIGCTNSRGLMLFWLNISPSYHDYIGTFTYFGKKKADGTYEAILAYDFATVVNQRMGITNKMLAKGRRWVYDYDNGQMKGTLTYSIEGDTLLHAYHRAKLCMTLVDNETNKVVRSGYVGAFHQLNEYLCYQAAGSNEDVFLYRFASNKGYFERNGIARYVVNDDSIVVNDNTYHRLLLLNYANGQLPLDKDSLYYWVEGIGSSKGLLEHWGGALADSIQFVACYDGETCIFTNDDFYKDSGQLLEFSTSLQKGPLWYFVDLSTKTASVSGSENCKSLSSIDILPSVELWGINCTVDKIADYAFKGLTRLESIIIPESVKEIGQDAFMDCTRLTSITFPDGLREIGYQSFRDCTRLTSITFPEGLKEIGYQAFRGCTGITSISWPSSLEVIGRASFAECNGLTSVILPEGITTIGRWAFQTCISLKVVDIPASVTSMDHNVFDYCESLEDVYCRPVTPPYNGQRLFYNANPDATLHVPAASLQVYKETAPWCDFKTIVPLETQIAYRPFVEEGKVWKVGDVLSGNPVQLVEYYYFDGDTIIGGKTCIKMMCQRYVNPDHAESHFIIQSHSISYVGAWYEEGKKVYVYDSINNQFNLMYDFSVNTNDTVQIRDCLYVVGPKQIGGIKGFKGVYENIRRCEDGTTSYSPTWMESVGSIDGPTKNVYYVDEAPMWFLMSCTVGDEVIYFNDEYEDGATPDAARKQRIDFTHTIKTRPKSRITRGAEASLYGEYNDQQLGINLDPLDDAYVVRIIDQTGRVVYEKAVNAGTIVGLNIDISDYAEGRYTITVENNDESFTAQFDTQKTGISLTPALIRGEEAIYNLQGQRISSLRKGLNIVNGGKVYVK